MKKMYTAPATEITINAGKLNFFEAPRTFADMVDAFANSRYKIACIEKECKAMIAARRTLIEEKTNYAEKSAYVDSTALEAELAELNAQIETIQERKKTMIASLKSKQFEVREADLNVWYAYREFKAGTLSKKDYTQAVAMWFASFDTPAHAETIKAIIANIGVKKASNGQILKSNGQDFTAIMNKNAYIDLFYNIVADMCAKAGTIKAFNFNKCYYEA